VRCSWPGSPHPPLCPTAADASHRHKKAELSLTAGAAALRDRTFGPLDHTLPPILGGGPGSRLIELPQFSSLEGDLAIGKGREQEAPRGAAAGQLSYARVAHVGGGAEQLRPSTGGAEAADAALVAIEAPAGLSGAMLDAAQRLVGADSSALTVNGAWRVRHITDSLTHSRTRCRGGGGGGPPSDRAAVRG
jgi:hypothetical protein